MAALPLAALPGAVRAQETGFPSRPLTLVVPFPPGGSSDALTKPLADRLALVLGQPVLIQNVAGGGGTKGAAQVAAAPGDGYTLLMASSSHFVAEGLRKDLPYQYLKDFRSVAVMASVPVVLAVRSASPFGNAKELLAKLEADKTGLRYGTAGAGTVQHAAGEFLNRRVSARARAVHLAGGGPMQTALQAGEVDYVLDTLPSAMVNLRAGRIRALGVSSGKRMFALPEVPTLAQQGLPGFELPVWYGFSAPAGTPAAVVNQLNQAINRALDTGEVKAQLLQLGTQPVTASPVEWEGIARLDMQRWKRLIDQVQMQAS